MTRSPSGRIITPLGATALVVANMIGTGIFTTTGFLARDLGNPKIILLVWGVGGILALCGAAVYAELGAMLPENGGEYLYLSRAFKPWVGFLSGWISLIVGFSAPIAAAAMGFGSYLSAVVPRLEPTSAAAGLIVLLSLMHSFDVALGARVQTGFSVAKVLLILIFVVGGVTLGQGDWNHLNEHSSSGGFTNFPVSLIFVYFAFCGWNAAAYVAGEVKNPEKTVPLALGLGTAIVTMLYLALNAVFLFAVPIEELASSDNGTPVIEVGQLAASKMFGETAGNLLALLIALALISAVSAMIMAGPRVYSAMADDGLFFQFLTKRSSRGAPTASILLQGAVAVVMVLTATFDSLLIYIGFTLSIFASLTVAAAMLLRRREPLRLRPYRATGWPVTPLLFLALSVWMLTYSVLQRPFESLAGVLTLGMGGLAYLFWHRRGNRRSRTI